MKTAGSSAPGFSGPQDIYSEINGVPPDLIVYFGNLAWRSIGSIGLGVIHTFENDMGPDDANHAQDGIFIMCDPQQQACPCREARRPEYYRYCPDGSAAVGLPVPADMEGKAIHITRQAGSIMGTKNIGIVLAVRHAAAAA